MAMLYGTHICSDCGMEFKWDSQLANRYGSIPDVETIDPCYAHAKNHKNIKNSSYKISVHCPHCESYESFEFLPDV